MSKKAESSISMEFREFYAFEDTPKKEEDPTDINSSVFNAKLLFEKSTKTMSIYQLVAQEMSLVTDIESLDNDMQSLIYDNYTKFLDASDLVITFGENISVLESQVSDLKQSLNDASAQNDTISKGLRENREKIQRLIGIQRLLERIKFISRLPDVLKSNIKKKNYTNAVKFWIKVEKILRTQQKFPSFAKIYEESKTIMQDVQNKISEEMITTDISVENSVNDGILLVQLGTQLPIICSQLIHHRFLILDNILEELVLDDEPFMALSHLNDTIIRDASLFIKLYKERLLVLADSQEIRNKALGILSNFTTKFFERILPILPLKTLPSMDCKKLAAYIRLFIDLFTPLANESLIQQNIHKMIKHYTITRVRNIFDNAYDIINNYDDMQIVSNFIANFMTNIDGIINEFDILSMLDHKECTQMLVQNVRLLLSQFSDKIRDCEPRKGLYVAIIAENLATDLIGKVLVMLSKIDGEIPQSILARELKTQYLASSSVCIQRYVDYRRQQIEPLILSFYEEEIFSTKKNPNDIYDSSRAFLMELDDLWTALDALPKSEKTGSSASHLLYNTPIVPSFAGIRDDGYGHIDRLFTSINRLGLSKQLPLSKTAIFTSVVFYSIKTLLEVLRMKLLTSEAFNQVQIDAYYLYISIKDRINNSDLFATLVEELVNSAADRTFNAEPLDTAVLKSIAEK